MGSEATRRVPVIDFSQLDLRNPGTHEWDMVKGLVRHSLEEFGCFEALFDKVSPHLRKALLGAIKDLFALPFQSKQRTHLFNTPFPGYVGYPQFPVFDSMSFEHADVFENVEAASTVLWPEGNPDFSDTIQSFAKQVAELDQIVRRMVVESFGLERYLDEHMNSTDYLLKLYQAPPTAETKVGIPVHQDTNIVTVMYQNEVVGVEIQAKDGEWVTMKPSLDSFIVMIGQSLHAWTNGRLSPPSHRVMITGDETGYSASLFSDPKSNYTVKAPVELIDEEYPLLFKPFNYVEYLEYYHSMACRRTDTPLKSFCGF